jgi:hypothetical protein
MSDELSTIDNEEGVQQQQLDARFVFLIHNGHEVLNFAQTMSLSLTEKDGFCCDEVWTSD